MNAEELIADGTTFSFLRGECEKIIDTRKRLPDFVFRRPFARYFVIEYAHVYGGGSHGEQFVSFLSKMSGICRDHSVNYMILDPKPGDTHWEQPSSFGIVSFKPSSLKERYALVMGNAGISKILRGANLGVFWGSSLAWGIFADRISWELGVIAVPETIDVPTNSGLRCLNAAQIASYMASQYHWKKSVADDFNRRFFSNYPI
jgi:hypothetical protein